ncbi:MULTISPECIES: nucleotide exchange factor GrpE [Novosphingobium]|uniref:Protein GrpE n=2 Tax=Novosphingobium TaxID=165696 RepID=A0ABT0A9H3_9SPHN|nr:MULTISPECIES: nucleotide exchange factor GrpE [Novosphingobium]MCJ1959858.1 nucleotide exchange factor GrpE [Novosphingobium mangrovi (ex Hu et al. 2023)]MED5546628.1 nucleotide exchange factor GrpE [Pseudomonadota bacterium]QVM82560.1 nucleotide exchange factor GrpE [Novosphingobium decolorationis]
MTDDKTQPPVDQEVAKELDGVPEEMLDNSEANGDGVEDELARLREELETVKQEALYARAETQNVRRRLEKDIADARNYSATSFAREILSVSDNLARALSAIPADQREDEKMKNIVTGIEATNREIDKVFTNHGITRIAAMGLPLDPNQHQAMIEVPSADAEPGTVVQELQAGYMIKDRLLRPAMVAVAKKPD